MLSKRSLLGGMLKRMVRGEQISHLPFIEQRLRVEEKQATGDLHHYGWTKSERRSMCGILPNASFGPFIVTSFLVPDHGI
jgi:hypothetical protein